MSENKLLSFFPKTDKIKNIRVNQKESLDKLWECLDRGDKNITLCAPVGAGKSAIADTLFSYYNSYDKACLYTSPMNQLVDQVEESGFNDVKTLKGRRHYPCLSGRENCSKGFCQTEKCRDGKRRKCKERPYSDCNKCVCWKCIYKSIFQSFRDSKKGNTNFTLFMLGVTNNPGIIVIDEADTIEGTIRDFNSVTIPILINQPSFMDHIPTLKEYAEKLNKEAEAINPELSEATFNKREELLKLSGKILMMLEDYENFSEPWCISLKLVSQKTEYKPVTVDRFINPLLKNKIVIMMSATPQSYQGYSRIEVDSVFPIKTRQWQYVPLGRMSMDYRDKTIPKLAIWLKGLKGKTLVHCVSYATAEKIAEPLRMIGVNPFLQTNFNNYNNNENNVLRHDAVEAFVSSKDPNKILLSVKLDRGVDFWQPDILNNVIAVMPWPNPTDPLVKSKDKLLGQSWHAEEMARTIAQSMGRIFRNEKMGIYEGKEVPKRGYIIDSNFRVWYNKNKNLFPKWFTESQLL